MDLMPYIDSGKENTKTIFSYYTLFIRRSNWAYSTYLPLGYSYYIEFIIIAHDK